MRSVKITILVMASVLFTSLNPTRAYGWLLIDNGQINNIVDSHLWESVEVRNDFFDRITTVNLLEGAYINGSLKAYDRSRVNVSGGTIGGYLAAYDNSEIIISGGSIDRYGYLAAYDSSVITISGGSIDGGLRAWDNSRVTISGGTVNGGLGAYNSSEMTISGGSIDSGLNVTHSSIVNVSGGTIGGLFAFHSSIVNISGGTIDGYLTACDSSVITLSGGSIDRYGYLIAWPNSMITFMGNDFAINGIDVGYGEFDTGGKDWVYGTLTGTLASGDYLDNEFRIYSGSRIVLVPEPATPLLLGLGVVMLHRKRRSRL